MAVLDFLKLPTTASPVPISSHWQQPAPISSHWQQGGGGGGGGGARRWGRREAEVAAPEEGEGEGETGGRRG